MSEGPNRSSWKKRLLFAVGGVVAVLVAVVAVFARPVEGFVAFPDPDRTDPDALPAISAVVVAEAFWYAQDQPEWAGQWLDRDRDMIFYALTGDLDKHRAALAAAGVDFSTGQYEVVQHTYSVADLENVRLQAASWPDVAQGWDVLWLSVDGMSDSVLIGVPWADPVREAELLEVFADAFGNADVWRVIPGARPAFELPGVSQSPHLIAPPGVELANGQFASVSGQPTRKPG